MICYEMAAFRPAGQIPSRSADSVKLVFLRQNEDFLGSMPGVRVRKNDEPGRKGPSFTDSGFRIQRTCQPFLAAIMIATTIVTAGLEDTRWPLHCPGGGWGAGIPLL